MWFPFANAPCGAPWRVERSLSDVRIRFVFTVCHRFLLGVSQYLILIQLITVQWITERSQNRTGATGASGSQRTPLTWHHFALFNRDQVRATSTCPVEIPLIRSEYRTQTLARESPRMNISLSNDRRDLAPTNELDASLANDQPKGKNMVDKKMKAER